MPQLLQYFVWLFQSMYGLFIWLCASLKHIDRMHMIFFIITDLINRDKTQNGQGMILKKYLFDVEMQK